MKEPYYSTDLGDLYLGDCLEVMSELQENSIDLIVTDPPYGLNYNDGDLANYRERAFGGHIESMEARPIVGDDQETADLVFRDFLRRSKHLLKRGACCCCCCGGGGPKPLFARWTLYMDEEIGFKQAVVWVKPGLGMGIQFRRSYEFVLIAQNGSPTRVWNGGKTTSNAWVIPKIIPSGDQHPTQKPKALMAKQINLFSNTGDLVLDPFIGYGTTAVACEDLKRCWIGVDISEECCEVAAKRIEASRRQLKLF